MKTIKVKIREWDDMKEEFGLIHNTIECNGGFVPEMRTLCGKEVEIIFDDKVLDEWKETYTGSEWVISQDMVEPEYRNLMRVEG